MYGHAYHPKVGTIKRCRGIFSGTVVTNLMDGCVNIAVLGLSVTSDDKNTLIDIKVGGDDNVLFSGGKIDIDYIVSGVSRLGMKLNFDPDHMFSSMQPFMQFLGSK
jgi:hypothetical protein